MDPSPPALRSHPAVIASIVLAAVAVTACSGVAIAYMMGWVGHEAPSTPTAIAGPGQQVAGTAPDMGLLPGESVVTMPPPPRSAIPAPAPEGVLVAPKAAASQAAQPAERSAPMRPSYEERAQAPRAPVLRGGDGLCVNCGIVIATGAHGDFWDVEVRYEDGTRQTLRYPERPRFRAGERVHFEDGRLLSDQGR